MRSWSAWAIALMRRHWLVSALLAAGLALRAATQVAYHPALIYVDSLKYLYGLYPGADPLGYKVLLSLILAVGEKELHLAWPGSLRTMLEDDLVGWIIQQWRAAHEG